MATKGEICIRSKEHNHDPDFEQNEAEVMKFLCLERSVNTSEKPRGIIVSEIGVTTSSILNKLPDTKNLIDTITRYRKKKNFVPTDDDIPGNIKIAFSGEKFLIYDSKSSESNRILIFSTQTHISYLDVSEAWYCDGTFKSCPTEYEQVYTIMGLIKKRNVCH